MTEHCVCGRRKLPASGHLALGPVQAEIMQRLETIRELKIEAMRRRPPSFSTCNDLAREERDLRDRLTRLTHNA